MKRRKVAVGGADAHLVPGHHTMQECGTRRERDDWLDLMGKGALRRQQHGVEDDDGFDEEEDEDDS
jgi:hypothetical protein